MNPKSYPKTEEKNDFETELLAFQNEFVAFGARFVNDSKVRVRYNRLITKATIEIQGFALKSGSFEEAARLANTMRNESLGAVATFFFD